MSAAEQFKAAVTSVSDPIRDGTAVLSAAAQGETRHPYLADGLTGPCPERPGYGLRCQSEGATVFDVNMAGRLPTRS
jgi:hypothetical protein